MSAARILAVDDVASNLDVMKGMLAPYKVRLDCVSSGLEAIARIRDTNSHYDLVFMDQMMPIMDGREAVRIIREEIGSEYARTVPIIAFTADALSGNGDQFLAMGFDGFIPKPVDAVRLDTVLNAWIRCDNDGADFSGEPSVPLVESRSKHDEEAGLLNHKVEGVDFSAGIKRYASEETYIEVLRSYIRHTPELLRELRGLVASFQNAAFVESTDAAREYAIKVHGLKGSTFGICAEDVAQAAAALEYAARQKDYQTVIERNTALLDSVEALLERLRGLFMELDQTEEKRKRQEEPSSTLLTKLLEASKQFDIMEMETVMEELERYDYDQGAELVAWLREQVDNLEYASVMNRLVAFDETAW
jgi:CheY-like chemotaxis protein